MKVWCSLVREPVFRTARGFTMVELLVAVVIIGLVFASIVPYVLNLREVSNRQACADNLRAIRDAMNLYARHYGEYPRTRVDRTTGAWTAFTGADDPDPFSRESAVQPNDVTASMWLLVRNGYLREPRTFICPSSSSRADRLLNAGGVKVDRVKRGNFRSKDNLSYSILSPFNASSDYFWMDTFPARVALMADINPGVSGRRDDVTRPVASEPPEQQTWANSNNHDKAGQNVLYSDGSVQFESFAFCGSGYQRADASRNQPIQTGDNIYTALRREPLTGEAPPANESGFFGRDIGPAWQYDSYLIPSDD